MKNLRIIYLFIIGIFFFLSCNSQLNKDKNDLTNGYYYIISVHSGKYLEVPDNSMEDNIPLIQNSASKQARQQWSFQKNKENFYFIRSRMSSKYIDVLGCSSEDKKFIVQYKKTGNHCQQWTLKHFGDYYIFVSRTSSKCIDIPGKSKDDGVNLIQFTENKGLNQCWFIKPIEK